METKLTSPSAEPQKEWNAPKLIAINKSTIEGGSDDVFSEGELPGIGSGS